MYEPKQSFQHLFGIIQNRPILLHYDRRQIVLEAKIDLVLSDLKVNRDVAKLLVR